MMSEKHFAGSICFVAHYLNIFYSQSDNNRTITKSTIIPSPFADEVYTNDMK